MIRPKYFTRMYTVAKVLGISYPTIIHSYIGSDWLIQIQRADKTNKYIVDIDAFEKTFGIDLTEYLKKEK